jgi:hypothetical protein
MLYPINANGIFDIMIFRRVIIYLSAVILCLMIGVAYGQDWLGGGYVGPYSGDIGKYFTDPILYSNPIVGQTYQSKSGYYPGPYGVFPYYGTLPYYSDFRLNSLGAMTWEPFQKNWSETMEYAQTKSSFRVYPRPTTTYPVVQFPAPIYTTTQLPAATTGDSTATIVSQGMRGYQVFLDGSYIGTEGTGGDPLDGKFSFRVAGGQNHDVRVFDGQFNYPKTIFFERGGTKIINVEPGTAVYI